MRRFRGKSPCFLGVYTMLKRHLCLYFGISLSLAALAGCGSRAFQIQLVPTSQSLRETVIQKDDGLFVTDKIAVIDFDGLMVNRRRGGLLRASGPWCSG
jgi:hypothetical protein